MPLYGTKYALYSVDSCLLVFPYYEKQKPLKIRFKGHIKGRKKPPVMAANISRIGSRSRTQKGPPTRAALVYFVALAIIRIGNNRIKIKYNFSPPFQFATTAPR